MAVAAFLAMALVPAYLAYDAGLLPGPAQASADAGGGGRVTSVTSLSWPDQALGLAARGGVVIWEQRDPSAAVAGLWSYDARTSRAAKVLGRASTGKTAGHPAAAGDLIVWAAWPGRRGAGRPRLEAYDTATTRRWTVASAGRSPMVTGESVLWVEQDGDGHGDDVIRGSNSLTDEEYAMKAGGRVRAADAWGSWVVWIAGDEGRAEVWTASFGDRTRRRLARAATGVAIDRERVLWAAPAGGHTTAIVSWDRSSGDATILKRLPGVASSLSLTGDYATWVTTRASPGTEVWVYDFGRDRAYPVADGGAGRRASPVIAAGSVFWADDRGGDWALYRRTLRP
ncbi:MAG: hypothetical protein ACM3MJ_00700 [Deltaproteobacteria bacterium]